MTCSGIGVTYVIGSWFNWRTLALLGAIPCIAQLLGLFFIPESPRWLAKVGRKKELESALQRLRGKNTDISYEAAEIIGCTEHLNRTTGGGIKALFKRKYTHPIIVGIGLVVLQQFGGLIGYLYYMNFILASAGFPRGVGSVASSVVQIVGNILCIFLVDKFGRRPLLMVSAAGMCSGSLITGLSFLLQDYNLWKDVTPIMAITGILVFLAFSCIGVGGLPMIIISEIFPINIKGAAGSFASFVHSLASWTVSFTFNFLFLWSSAGVFFLYSIVAGLGVIFVAKFVPETNGRTLEEIQASISQ